MSADDTNDDSGVKARPVILYSHQVSSCTQQWTWCSFQSLELPVDGETFHMRICDECQATSSNTTHHLLLLYLPFPEALRGWNNMNDRCLSKAAQLKTSSPISALNKAPLGSLGLFTQQENILLSKGNMCCS